jgi:uncharacterized protein DUF5681
LNQNRSSKIVVSTRFLHTAVLDSRPRSNNYRKPPVEHQFKKGKSGNPNGRPKKKPGRSGLGALSGGIADRLGAMALDEAIRPVTVREGDKVSEMPAMQALFRTMFRAAAQGDTKAGRRNQIIYLVGLIVVVLAILSFFGLR